MVREEMLFGGQEYLEMKDWPLMNDHDVALLIGMHSKDFIFYFGSKHQYEKEVLELYADQHLLDAKTLLSCCFRRPINRVKRYLVYMTGEYTSKPELTNMLFSPLGGIQHRNVSEKFLERLTILLADCLKETFEAIRLEMDYLIKYSRGIIESLLVKLKKMSREERVAFSQSVRKNSELLMYPESDALLHLSE